MKYNDFMSNIKELTPARLKNSSWGNYPPIVVSLLIVLLICVVPPLIFLIMASLHETNIDGSMGAFTLDNYLGIAGGMRFFRNLTNSFVFAIGSALVAIAIGGLQAWIVERTNTPGRKYVLGVAIISLGVPSVLYTVAFLLILGKTGPINQILMALIGTKEPVFNVYSLFGMILVQGIEASPLCYLLLSAVFRNNDPALEEAAFMSGAHVGQILRRVTLPLAMPAILGLLILTFIRSIEAFETPALVGRPGRVNVLTTDIFGTMQHSPPYYGEAGAFSVILLIIVSFLLFVYSRIAKNASKYQTISGKGFRPRIVDLGSWRYLTLAILILFFAITVIVPMAMLAWVSFQPYYEGVTSAALWLITIKHYKVVFASESFHEAIGNTLILSASTAVIVVSFTALCAWLVTRQFRGSWLLDQLCSAPLIFPSIVLAVAMLEIFLNLPIPVYGSLLSIVIASSIHSLPYGMRYSYAGIIQINRELEEAASISGASGISVFIRIVIPLVFPALVAGGLFIFLVTAKAVSIPILLSGPNSRVVSVSIFDMWQNGLLGELSAIGILWSLFMMAVSLFFLMFIRRFGISVR
jgi:iron(III) transport system permease protein